MLNYIVHVTGEDVDKLWLLYELFLVTRRYNPVTVCIIHRNAMTGNKRHKRRIRPLNTSHPAFLRFASLSVTGAILLI